MYRNGLLFLMVFMAIGMWSCMEQEELVVPQDVATMNDSRSAAGEPLTREHIDALAIERLKRDGNFKWSMSDPYVVWSALMHSDGLLSVGYKASGFEDVEKHIHEIDIQESAWQSVKEELQQAILDEERKATGRDLEWEDIAAFRSQRFLPFINVKVTSLNTVRMLWEMEDVVRYVEPMGYGLDDKASASRSDAGCGELVAASYVYQDDYVFISPTNTRVPWSFYYSNIPNAWSYGTGSGVTVAILDTGTSDNQSRLNGDFSSGYSTGRTITRLSTHWSGWWWWASLDSPHDPCGHGTQMAGTIAAPRSGSGATTGVAYGADMVAYRATSDVVINGSSEKDGVTDALVDAANRSGVRAISMSLGDPFWSSQVADGVYYAYNRGKMVIAAAGTSFSWTTWYGVTFPANMAQTVAVTGIEDASNMTSCDICHEGSAVDFVVVMQRYNDNSRVSLTLADSGAAPSYVGGSSTATAHTAGIASLIWGVDPNQTREQVLQRMKDASQFYPARHGDFGWGLIDAAQAVASVYN